MLENLELKTIEIFKKYNVSEKDSKKLFKEISVFYSEPEKKYHNLHHIASVMKHLESLSEKILVYSEPAIACLFHDVIYDSKAKDNEERSAEYAREKLYLLKFPTETRERISQYILSTKKHFPLVEGYDNLALLDSDLCILGANPEVYETYMSRVRDEYSWVSEKDYRSGRKQVLESFMNRESIYFTLEMKTRYEEMARRNMKKEIESL